MISKRLGSLGSYGELSLYPCIYATFRRNGGREIRKGMGNTHHNSPTPQLVNGLVNGTPEVTSFTPEVTSFTPEVTEGQNASVRR